MDKALEKYYEGQFSMFATDGWRDMVADVQQMIDATNRLDGVTAENLQFRQGELSIMRWLLAREQAMNDAYKELTDASDA